MIDKIGVQLYTIRDFMKTPEDVRASFKRIKELGYDQAQTAGCAIPYEDFARIAKEEKIELVGTHENFQRMIDDFDEALRIQKLFDCPIMGIGGAGWGECKMEKWQEIVDNINIVCQRLKPLGMKFSYHNHSHEFYRFENGVRPIDMICNQTDPEVATICLDTYWVQNGGADIRYWIEKLKNRIEILHLKDMKKPDIINDFTKTAYCEIGEGNMWWEGILQAAEDANVKYYVVEQDTSDDPFKSLEMSSNFIHKHFMK